MSNYITSNPSCHSELVVFVITISLRSFATALSSDKCKLQSNPMSMCMTVSKLTYIIVDRKTFASFKCILCLA
uniref:Uncharacterized protein n=1 Tax=Arundo donax TaxID=35708 RepID=A0A0A8ZT77_ARUDO